MKKVSIDQNTDEWIAWRQNIIGASDTPIILGLSPFKTPLELYKEKIGLVERDFSNFATSRGHALESTARYFYEEETGIFMEPGCFESDEFPWLGASLDGWSEKKKIHLEIKCPGTKVMKMAEKGVLPKDYYAQMQQQLLVTENDYGHYYCFSGVYGRLVIVKRDEKLQSIIVKKTKEFCKMLQNKTPPPLSPRDYQTIENKELIDLVNEYRKKKIASQKINNSLRSLQDKIASRCDHKKTIVDGLKIIKSVRKSQVSYKKLAQEKINLAEIDLEKYRGEPYEYVALKDTKSVEG